MKIKYSFRKMILGFTKIQHVSQKNISRFKHRNISQRGDSNEKDILKGKKTPCCWPGCPHRRESAKKWFK